MQVTSKFPPIPDGKILARERTAKVEKDRFLAKLCAGAAAGKYLVTDENIVTTRDGRAITMNTAGDPTVGDVVVPTTRGSSEVHASFIALDVAPATWVAKYAGKWFAQSSLDATQQALPDIADPNAQLPEISPRFLENSYSAPLRGLAFRASSQLATNADFDLMAVGATRLGLALGLRRELECAALVMKSATWPGANVAAATAKWNTGSGTGVTRIADIYARFASSTLMAHTLVISEAVEAFFFGNGSEIQVFRQACGGELPFRVIVGRAKVKGPSGLAYPWGSSTSANAAIVAAPASTKDTASFRTFQSVPPGVPSDRVIDGVAFHSSFLDDHGSQGAFYLTANVVEQVVAIGASDGVGGLITGVIA